MNTLRGCFRLELVRGEPSRSNISQSKIEGAVVILCVVGGEVHGIVKLNGGEDY